MFEVLAAILEPFQAKMAAVQQLAPRVAAATLLLAIAWCLAGFARMLSRRTVRAKWLEWLLQRSGLLSTLADPSLFEPRRLLSGIFYWGILLAGSIAALGVVDDELARGILALAVALMPKTVIGLATIASSNWLGRYWGRSALIWMTNEGFAFPWRWALVVHVAVVAFGIALASEFTGVARELIRPAFLLLLAGAVFSVAYGVGPSLRLHVLHFFGDTRADRASQQRADDPLLR